MFEWITQPQAWIALGTLTVLEIVLGIDNIIFIYLAMAFSVFVEMLNLRMRRGRWETPPVRLRQRIAPRRPSPLPPRMRMIDGD